MEIRRASKYGASLHYGVFRHELGQLLFCLQCNKVNSSVQLFSFPPTGTSAAKSSRRNATKKYRRGGGTYPLTHQK